jgi:isoleucyl-tRNA synthetase
LDVYGSTDSFVSAWLEFVRSISTIGEVKIDLYLERERRKEWRSAEQQQRLRDSMTLLRDLLRQVTEELAERGPHVLDQMLSELSPTESMMAARLTSEMIIVTNLANVAASDQQETGNEASPAVDTATDAAKTVKDSLEKFLKRMRLRMPGWLKNSLEVLNELLSLVKAV